MNAEDFRRIALGMADAVEGAHMGHPDFRVNGRIFATLHPDHRHGMVKLTPDQQQQFVREIRRHSRPRMAHGDVRDARACGWIKPTKRRSGRR